MSVLRDFLALSGKGERKVVAVFADSPEACRRAVAHLRAGVPDLPVWVFSTRPADVACDHLVVDHDPLALLMEAQKRLWPHWVALSVVAWTGTRAAWPLKLGAFLVPFFHVLVLNEHGDFFAATSAAIGRHLARRGRDAIHSGVNRLRDVNRGAWLWLFARIAQRSAFLSRRWFHQGHGTQTLAIDAPPSGEGVLTLRHPRRHWNWAEVCRAVRESHARYVLFLEGDANGDGLPRFEDPGTFAVSRQVDYRDWKEGLFATAAFRPLQEGEASRVLAPVSTAMLADRAKLAALGIPKTIVPGTAWLELFWRAAAAGWRSYSIGDGGPAGASPDWPYEEAEFVTRVLATPALRMLGPREPDLARGSIAFSYGGARPFRGLPRVLIVSPYLPWPLAHGGAVRIYNLCRALRDRYDLVLACFRETGEAIDYSKLHDVFREVYVLDRDERASRDRTLPGQVREHVSRSLRALIASLEFDLMQIEFTHLAHFRDAAPAKPAILVEHDLTFTLYQQYARKETTPAAHAEAERWHAFERNWLRQYDGVWTMSEADRAIAVQEGAPAGRTRTIANGVDLERFAPLPERPGGPPEVFYIGSFRHTPNVIGFERLRADVMPAVWARHPEARLRVVAGPEPERYWPRHTALDRRITMHAFVADVRPLYESATVVAVPLEVSAGTNIKVMEAMASGRAVVSTPAGGQGLGLCDGVDAVIREKWDAFAEAVCELIAAEGRRKEIARNARATVEARFGWEAIAREAAQSWDAVISQRARKPVP